MASSRRSRRFFAHGRPPGDSIAMRTAFCDWKGVARQGRLSAPCSATDGDGSPGCPAPFCLFASCVHPSRQARSHPAAEAAAPTETWRRRDSFPRNHPAASNDASTSNPRYGSFTDSGSPG